MIILRKDSVDTKMTVTKSLNIKYFSISISVWIWNFVAIECGQNKSRIFLNPFWHQYCFVFCDYFLEFFEPFTQWLQLTSSDINWLHLIALTYTMRDLQPFPKAKKLNWMFWDFISLNVFVIVRCNTGKTLNIFCYSGKTLNIQCFGDNQKMYPG